MTIAEDITVALQEREGPLSVDDIVTATGHDRQKLYRRLWEMKRSHQVESDPNHQGIYWLPDLPPENKPQATTNGRVETQSPASSTDDDLVPLSGDEDEFKRLLVDCSVTRARETITRTFFGGDHTDMENLVSVLQDARAYVNIGAARMILRYWARYIGGDLAQLPKLEERLESRTSGSSQTPDEDHFIEEMGWQVVKDKDGDWITKPGGELTQREALKWAATNNAIRPAREDDAEEDEAPRGRRGSRQPRQEQQPNMLEIIQTVKELMTPAADTSGKDDQVRILTEKIDQMDRDRQDDRMGRLEELIGAAVNRNPVTEFLAMREQMDLLNPRAGVTDNSPTVQLVKDTSDKLDRNMTRLTGIIERVALRAPSAADEEIPDHQYTPQEREDRAGKLAERMSQNNESKQLRQQLFGR